MNQANFLIVLIVALVGFAASVGFADNSKETFPEQVEKALSSDWTEMVISSALLTDYGKAFGVAIRLRRDGEAKPPLVGDLTEQDVERLSDTEWKLLSDAILKAARSCYEHWTPMEIFNSLPPEKTYELVKSGKLKIGPSDTEVLVLAVKTPKGEVRLQDQGPSQPLAEVIQKLMKTKWRKLKGSELKTILGINPYEDLE